MSERKGGMSGLAAAVYSAHVDWLTMTTKDDDQRAWVERWAGEKIQLAHAAGFKVKSFQAHGYVGWSSGGVTWGRRERDDIVRLSGESAAAFWAVVGWYCTNVSRVDLAVTVKLPKDVKDFARRYADGLDVLFGDKPPRKYRMYDGLNSGGDTLMVGSRASKQYGRVYDKWRECGEDRFRNCWRFEVELKDELAFKAVQSMLKMADPQKNIAAYVWEWFTGRYVQAPWGRDDTPSMVLETGVKITDNDRTLEWLRTSVSPSVARLINEGRDHEVCDALGYKLSGQVFSIV